MDRIAAALMIAIAALIINGGLVRDVLAEDLGRIPMGSSVAVSDIPVASGLRSERVLSLLIALEALRAAPEALNRSKG
ncbi:MAG: hypothetical protein IPK28_11430 [Devosia sp.]|nr:hypothetical protein [Devosia sp.]